MSGCGNENCVCGVGSSPQKVEVEGFPLNVTRKTAEQPDGWHPCLKQKTRCVIIVLDLIPGQEELQVEEFEAYNSCHVDDAEECPRVSAGSKTGEDYELCGPPNHAEEEAAKLILKTYPDGAPDGSTAFLYGHTYLCGPCQEALVAAGVRHFVVTGEPA